MLDEHPQRRRRLPLDWLALALAGCVVYELTQSPALGSVLVCLKFGWEDALAARWLWRNDPEKWRRKATFWLYLSWGLWKVALVAFCLSTAFALLAGPQALRAFLGTFLLTLSAFGLSSLMTCLALFHAWRGGVRLWLDRAVHRARRRDDWPPTPFCEGRKNRLGTLVLSELLGAVIVALLVAGLRLAPGDWLVPAVLVPASVLVPVALMVCYGVVCHCHEAHQPRDCWPEEEL